MADRGVLAFDLYGTLVDPTAISAELDRTLAGGQGREIAALWRLKQLEYSFRLTVMGRYQDFGWVTARALDFACASTRPDPVQGTGTAAHRALTTSCGRSPSAGPALSSLARAGYELAVLSNGSPGMIRNCLANSGLGAHVGQRISVDDVRAFKPSPLVYHHAAQRLHRPVGTIRLVSCNAFDVAGALAAGMSAAWVNRGTGPFDTIGPAPEMIVSTLGELAEMLAS